MGKMQMIYWVGQNADHLLISHPLPIICIILEVVFFLKK